MAEENAVLWGLRPDMQKQWEEMVTDAVEYPEGPDRQGAVLKIAQIAILVSALADGMAPADALKLLDPKIDLVMAVDIIRDVAALAGRGEEFRLWWNAWHGRVHEDDANPREGQEPRQEPRQETRREIFNPGLVNFNGKWVQIMAKFDSSVPLTKRADYNDIVKNAIRAAGLPVRA